MADAIIFLQNQKSGSYPSLQAWAACETNIRNENIFCKLLTDFLVLIDPIIRQQDISLQVENLRLLAIQKTYKETRI